MPDTADRDEPTGTAEDDRADGVDGPGETTEAVVETAAEPLTDEEIDAGEPDAAAVPTESGIWPIPPVVIAPLLWLTDRVSTRATGRPTTVRWRTGPLAALRGRVDLLTVGVHGMQVRGLELDRVVAKVHDARLHPGIEPRVTGGPVQTTVTVTQAGIDRWIGRVGLPFRLELTADGIMSSAGMGALRVGRLLTHLDVVDGWLLLRPVRAVGRNLPKALGSALTGNLPLPALPEDAQMAAVRHREGRISVNFELGDLDEVIDLGTADRLRARIDAISPAPQPNGK